MSKKPIDKNNYIDYKNGSSSFKSTVDNEIQKLERANDSYDLINHIRQIQLNTDTGDYTKQLALEIYFDKNLF